MAVITLNLNVFIANSLCKVKKDDRIIDETKIDSATTYCPMSEFLLLVYLTSFQAVSLSSLD